MDPVSTVAFVTGNLAEFSLRRTLERLAPSLPFEARVVRLNIAVAALMTTDWVARHLKLPEGIERVVLPGFCSGDPEVIANATGAAVERGPKDLRDLPAFLGKPAAATEYGKHDIEIIAEINHVPQLSTKEILDDARRYRERGADVIDLGCDPAGPFSCIADVVRELRAEGFRISVDSLDPREIEPAVKAGAELVLSINATNIDVARELGCEVVVIPDEPSSLTGLHESVAKLETWGVPFRIDPVIEPIGFGFAKSLGRYIEVRERYPDAAMLMGIGNLTELTDADSAPINLILLGFCQELGIRSVLTTEVISWAQTSVAECELGRRLTYHAVTHKTLPKHLEPGLHLLRDESVKQHGLEILEDLATRVKDRNFRIFAEGGEIHIISRAAHLRGTDPFELFEQLEVEDSSHAFYLGYEMAKAVTALTLDKSYVQDQALRWGFLTVEEKGHLERQEKRGKPESQG